MWFKNIGVYQIKDFECDDADLHERALAQKFEACKPHEEDSYGWIPPFGVESKNFAPSANGFVMLKVQFEKRTVSSSEINMILDQEILKLKEADPEIIINNKMKKNMKQSIKEELQPRAPSSVSSIAGFIDAKTGFLYIDGTPSKCEKFAGALRFLHPEMDMEIVPIQTQDDPKETMTNWILNDEFPEILNIGNAFSIKDIEDMSEIEYKKATGYSDKNLNDYLTEGKRVVKMKVDYIDNSEDEKNISLVINDDFHISSVKWNDEIEEIAASDYAEIPNANHDEIGSAILGVMAKKSKEISNYLLNKCFGGVRTEEENEEEKEGDNE